MALKRAASASFPAQPERTNMVEFAEQVDASLEDGFSARSRRARVKVDGYESDSTDDGEGVVESRKGKNEGTGDDFDMDMFAPDDKASKEQTDTSGKKKKTEYLELGDIEGQEFNDEEDEEEGLSEYEPEDEDDENRRKKAGMGFELSGFNMKEEMEEGKFDSDGTFIRTHDPHTMHDRWMEGVNDKEIQKARRNKKLREKDERKREAKEEKEKVSTEQAERELVGYLKRSETVLEALQRLGAATKEHNYHTSRRKSTKSMDVDQTSHVSAKNTIREAINRITTLASILMSHGNIDIYSWTYEQLLRSVHAAGEVKPDWIPLSHSAIYEYKWTTVDDSDGGQSNFQIYGPYKEEELLCWYNANYFGNSGEKIQLRRVGENEWLSWDEIVF